MELQARGAHKPVRNHMRKELRIQKRVHGQFSKLKPQSLEITECALYFL
jgi:hypothetical protein